MYKKTTKMFAIVKRIIDEWNPYFLLPDAPEDKFDGESAMIQCKINENSSIEEIANVILKVFQEMFVKDDFNMNECLKVARKIKTEIEATKSN